MERDRVRWRPGRRQIVVVTALALVAITVLALVVVTPLVGGVGARRHPAQRPAWNNPRPSASAPATPAPTTPAASQAPVTVSYPAGDASPVNPERGFAHLTRCDNADLSATSLRGYRSSEGITLIWCMFYLAEFKTTDIAASALARLDRQFAAVRSAGSKMVLRFAYTEDEAGDDAAPAIVQRHIAQLKPHLQGNADVLLTVQAGFIGTWGEWYYTRHFGDPASLSSTDAANRRAVLDALLAAVPDSRMVQVRTPSYKRSFFGSQALPAAQAHTGTARSRIGFHNDCFLATGDDMGTFADPTVERPYLASETAHVLMGGETCQPAPPRTQCPGAKAELARYHWTYANIDYHPDVIAGWRLGGCLTEIQRTLGYRLSLQQATFPRAVARGAGLHLSVSIRNDGWAAPANPRRVQLVLRDGTGRAVRRLPIEVDPRQWAPGTVATVNTTVTLPGDLPAGGYGLALALVDPAPTLAARPEYAIGVANPGLWDAATGTNDLRHTVTVTP